MGVTCLVMIFIAHYALYKASISHTCVGGAGESFYCRIAAKHSYSCRSFVKKKEGNRETVAMGEFLYSIYDFVRNNYGYCSIRDDGSDSLNL